MWYSPTTFEGLLRRYNSRVKTVHRRSCFGSRATSAASILSYKRYSWSRSMTCHDLTVFPQLQSQDHCITHHQPMITLLPFKSCVRNDRFSFTWRRQPHYICKTCYFQHGRQDNTTSLTLVLTQFAAINSHFHCLSHNIACLHIFFQNNWIMSLKYRIYALVIQYV